MRYLQSLVCDGLRNLTQLSLQLHPDVNLFYGENGAGKSSILEAVHLLGLGRSFRTNKLQSLVHFDSDELVVRGQSSLGEWIALSKRAGASRQLLKFNGQPESNWQRVLEILPLQVLNSESFDLLSGSSRMRRRYLDWGVFHVEHRFIDDWRGVAVSLRQRNALLKQVPRHYRELKAWDQGFVTFAERVNKQRQHYYETLCKYLEVAIDDILPEFNALSFTYYRGWSDRDELADLLEAGFERDRRYGATQVGPHRADMLIRVEGQPASSVLSRGQMKMLVIALKLAQARCFLQQEPLSKLIYLIDDLPSELDKKNSAKVMDVLGELHCQLFVTAVDAAQLAHIGVFSDSASMFHVEHGKISH